MAAPDPRALCDTPRSRWVDLLAHAYGERPAINTLLQRVGFDPAELARRTENSSALWTWAIDVAVERGLFFDLVSVVLHDEDATVFHPPLLQLVGPHIAAVNARTVALFGMKSAAVRSGKALDGLAATLDSTKDAQPVSGLQAVMDPKAGLIDARAWLQISTDAMRRTAMIRVGGHAKGTGVLVGSDLLLTAAHVLDSESFPPKLAPGVSVEAVFDFYAGPAAPAETGHVVAIVDVLAGSLPSPGERTGTNPDWEVGDDFLDFCLVKLARSVATEVSSKGGEPRGAYAIPSTEFAFSGVKELFIVQHPLRQHQLVSTMNAPCVVNAARTRVRYRGNTLPGSSGAPVIDASTGRLVALHHFAATGANQGIVMSAIARHLEKCSLSHLVNGVNAVKAEEENITSLVEAPAAGGAKDPFETNVFGRKPFVNRVELRQSVRKMFPERGSSPVLVINGGEGSGKSYSYKLLDHLEAEHVRSKDLRELAPGGIRTVKIDLDEYTAVSADQLERRLLDDMLAAMDVTPPADRFAQDARTLSNVKQWLPNYLRKTGKLWWLFWDSLDRATLTTGAEDLIFGLAELVDERPTIPLRVVLVAGNRELPSELGTWAVPDLADALTARDADAWITAHASAERRTVDQAKLKERLADLFPNGGSPPSPRTLAPKLVKLFDEVTGGAA